MLGTACLTGPELDGSISFTGPAGSGMPDVERHFAGFSFRRGKLTSERVWVLELPLWTLPLSAVLPTYCLLWRGRRPRPRHRYRTCPGCQYDLRATADRCPECGWIRPDLVFEQVLSYMTRPKQRAGSSAPKKKPTAPPTAALHRWGPRGWGVARPGEPHEEAD